MKALREFLARFSYRYILPGLVWVLYRLLSLTWKIHIEEPASLQTAMNEKTPVLFAHWHGDELAYLSLIGKYRLVTITSTSLDGDMMDRMARLQGAMTVRGSSTRGGASALRGLLRIAKQHGRNSSFAVDGPKGPIYKAKPGIFEVSRLLNAVIYPGGVFCDRVWVFPRTWNKAFLPKPFARLYFYWDEARPALERGQDPHDPQFSTALEEALHHSRQIAAKKNFAQ